jgi:hypothetical protein
MVDCSAPSHAEAGLTVDGRRRHWLAISVDLMHSTTGTKLQELGPGAVEAWIGMLAAAKRAPIEGRFSFVNESEAWEKMGVTHPERLSYTLEDLLNTLGRQKQTKKTRRGRVTNVEITQWEHWQKSRSDGINPTQKPDKNKPDSTPDQDQDQYQDHDNYQDRMVDEKRGLRAAIDEASQDPTVRNPRRVGRYRFNRDPWKYNASEDLKSTDLSQFAEVVKDME